jgi:hypothetical protein
LKELGRMTELFLCVTVSNRMVQQYEACAYDSRECLYV